MLYMPRYCMLTRVHGHDVHAHAHAHRGKPLSKLPALAVCHVCALQLNSEHFDLLDEASEEEDDMLDEATCLSATSRLGCQIILSKELEGMEVTLPAYSRNYYVDGHIPEPH